MDNLTFRSQGTWSPLTQKVLEYCAQLSGWIVPSEIPPRGFSTVLSGLATRLQEESVLADFSKNQIKMGLLWGALDQKRKQKPQGEEPSGWLSYPERERLVYQWLHLRFPHCRNHRDRSLSNQPDQVSVSATPTLYVMSGIPGSGKSTWLSHQAQHLKPVQVVSTDELRQSLWGNVHDQTRNAEIFAWAHQQVRTWLRQKNSVLFDATGILRKHRTPLWRLARFYHARSVVVVMDTSLEEAIKRNQLRARQVPEHILVRFYLRWQRPTRCEADCRWIVSNGGE